MKSNEMDPLPELQLHQRQRDRQTEDRAREQGRRGSTPRARGLETLKKEEAEEGRAGGGSHAGKTREAPGAGAGCVAPVRDRVATPVVAFGTPAAHPAFPARGWEPSGSSSPEGQSWPSVGVLAWTVAARPHRHAYVGPLFITGQQRKRREAASGVEDERPNNSLVLRDFVQDLGS